MKSKILTILRKEQEIISGEDLSNRLGVSRVTIWKHLKSLQKLGYQINVGPKGYQYSQDNDFLYPWEFGSRSNLIHHHKSIPSTMAAARELARNGAPDQTLVIAESQTKGRGRMQRLWISDKGGLYFTIILRPDVPVISGFLLNFITSTALVETIREFCSVDARVKWPNDILIGNSKICGMLSEMEATDDMVTFINIGIGLNVNNNPTNNEPTATSLKLQVGKNFNRRALLTDFLDRLQGRLSDLQLENAVARWKEYTLTIGRQVRIVTTKKTFEGKAVDVDNSGALLLRQDDGNITKVIYGDCFHI